MSRNRSTAPRTGQPSRPGGAAFSLIELLVVVAIITALLGLLMPALGGARKQAKRTACLARLKDMGNATVNYATSNSDVLPPMMIDWDPAMFPEREVAPDAFSFQAGYGWAELLYADMFPQARVTDRVNFPAQRNYEDKYARVFNCPEGTVEFSHSGHYRVYEPGWSREATGVDPCTKRLLIVADRLRTPTRLSHLNPLLPLIGDATEDSTRGNSLRSGNGYDGLHFLERDRSRGACREVDSSFIGLRIPDCPTGSPQPRRFDSYESVFNEANMVHPDGCVPNRFAHRHLGGANYLLGDMHAEHSRTMREDLACDWDLNGVHDAESTTSRRLSGCPHAPTIMGGGD